MLFNRMHAIVIVSLFVAASGFSTAAQAQPWDVFEDALSTSVCDVVNTANAELVVLSDTGQLVIVTGADVILEDTFVDANNDVFFEDQQAGFITFADDGDGFRTLWWVSLTCNVIHVDGFTGEPSETSLLPSDFTDVPDDACEFWDDQTVCPQPVVDPVSSPIIFNICGRGGASTMVMTAVGLGVMGLIRRRWG